MGVWLLILAMIPGEASPQFDVATLDGAATKGSLSALGSEELVVQSLDGEKKYKLTDVRAVSRPDANEVRPADSAAASATKAAVWLETVDGSRFPAATYSVSHGVATLGMVSGEAIEVPVKAIKFVEFRASDRGGASWLKDVRSDVTADLIVVRKGDGVDFVEGSAGDVNDETVRFTVDSDAVPVKRQKVAGIVYFHPENADTLPAATCVLDDVGGARLQAKSVALGGNGQLEIVATFGAKLSWPLDTLRRLDFSTSRMTYLSELTPDATDFTPYLDFGKQAASMAQFYQPRHDRCLDGGPLRLNRTVYGKGLSIASRTSLSYKIAGKGQRFKALAGIDDSVGGAGAVRLQITGDGKKLFEGKIAGRDKPVDLDLDVAGVHRLNILVDFGEGLDVGNYLDLCDARIVK